MKQDDEFRKLVEEVRAVRKLSNVCPSAQDGVDIPILLKKIIDEEVYRGDYQNVTARLLEEEVDYDVAIKALDKIMINF